MGGDDLGSDDESLYASDHSSSVIIHEQESDTDEHINPTIVPTNQKRKADETSVTSSKKKSKKASEESVVVFDPGEKNVCNEIFFEFGGKANVSRRCGVLDDMDNQSEKAISELLPSIWSVVQAVTQQISI